MMQVLYLMYSGYGELLVLREYERMGIMFKMKDIFPCVLYSHCFVSCDS